MIPFRETTRQIRAGLIEAPGQEVDGKTIGDTLSANGARFWGAVFGGYSWSIVYEPGLPDWSDDVRRQFVGFTATYRRADHNSSSQTIPVEGGPFATLADAERACRRLWHSIKNAN
jgi:hypothetical protein